MENHAADELHIEMPHAERAFRRLSDRCKRFRQKLIEALAICEASTELGGFAAQRFFRERLEFGLKRVDPVDLDARRFELAVVLTAENALCDVAKP